MEIENTEIKNVHFIHPQVFRDERGFFMETFQKDVWKEAGLDLTIVQANHSGSIKDVVRGLHFQWEPPMGKLMRVTKGAAFLVAVDIRKDSPTLGSWVGRELDADEPQFFWAPAGCARGFAVLSDYAEIQYLTTGTYNNKAESGILWNDPAIGIKWPVASPILSDKDKIAQTLEQWLETSDSNNFTMEKSK
ncbi:MAG: dTDP-4-dehydrorhamnose 3,5-epimerase [Deltaproteobacteria bacterium]|nr:dTDP-4-dehydrorhamnose 3,5-epimerase [Deltaproteobacteria bacterium]